MINTSEGLGIDVQYGPMSGEGGGKIRVGSEYDEVQSITGNNMYITPLVMNDLHRDTTENITFSFPQLH